MRRNAEINLFYGIVNFVWAATRLVLKQTLGGSADSRGRPGQGDPPGMRLNIRNGAGEKGETPWCRFKPVLKNC
jgi:hypothetical protein